MNKIVREFEITDQELSDLMVTALEGGINYWCSGCDVVEPDGNLRPSDALLEDGWCLSFLDMDPMVAILLDKEGLLNGVARAMEWGNFATVEALMDGHDAETADVMIQFALFGEIVYG
jgi:hypothetical protein